MKSIHVRNIKPETLIRLQQLAQQNQRSLNDEVLAILDRAVNFQEPSPSTALKLHTVKTNYQGTWTRDEIYPDL